MWPAPDVIPQICRAIDEVSDEAWDAAADLDELTEIIRPVLEANGATRFDFSGDNMRLSRDQRRSSLCTLCAAIRSFVLVVVWSW